ncbi:MAG: hypothetical protein Q8O93_01595 [bacterium]|nr:hypothetical protein [bacterium]
MSTLYKCDKCGKTIKNNKKIRISITDFCGVFGKMRLMDNFELCDKCGNKHLIGLTKIFSALKNNNKK